MKICVCPVSYWSLIFQSHKFTSEAPFPAPIHMQKISVWNTFGFIRLCEDALVSYTYDKLSGMMCTSSDLLLFLKIKVLEVRCSSLPLLWFWIIWLLIFYWLGQDTFFLVCAYVLVHCYCIRGLPKKKNALVLFLTHRFILFNVDIHIYICDDNHRILTFCIPVELIGEELIDWIAMKRRSYIYTLE